MSRYHQKYKMASFSDIVGGLLPLLLCITIGLVDHVQSQPIRLVGGSSSREGRVEIFYGGQWGTVCDDNWDDNDARVVCRQLGFSALSAVAWTDTLVYGQGTGYILLDEVRCLGSESSLESCPSNGWYSHNCDHTEDAGVRCGYGSTTPTYSIRLVGGSSSSEGRVEILYGGQWGTVCDDSWDEDDARVVCRQLGFSTDSAVAWTNTAAYGQGTGPILLDEVRCYGYEFSLSSCPSDGWYINDCSHFEDAGVRCNEGPPRTSTRVTGTMSFVGISLFVLLVFGVVMVYRSCNSKANSNSAVRSTELTTVTNVGSTPSNQYAASPSAVMTQGAPVSSPPPVAAPAGGALPPPYPTQAGPAYGHPQGNASQPSGPALSGEQSLGSQQPGPGQVTSGQAQDEHEYLEVNPEAPGEENTYLVPNPASTPGGENTYQQLDSTQQENSYQDLTPSRN